MSRTLPALTGAILIITSLYAFNGVPILRAVLIACVWVLPFALFYWLRDSIVRLP